MAAVTHWLANHSDWLLIFDNVEDPELVKRVLPSARRGCFLFTSRRQALELSTQTLHVKQMTAEEGTRFLLHRAKLLDLATPLERLPATEVALGQEIVAIMGGLPLALDQAGAYIEATQCSLLDYLNLLQSSPLRLLAEREASADHPFSVTQTFMLAFERLEGSNSRAAELLTVCAFLAPEDIPEHLFLVGAAQLGPIFEVLIADPFEFQAALKALLTYSLLQRHAATHTLTVHRLVQMVLQNRMPKSAQAEWTKRVIQVLDHTFPTPSQSQQMEYWSWCEQVVPHALKVLSRQPAMLDPLAASSLWYKIAVYLHHRGRYLEAESYHKQTLDVRERMLSSQHLGLSEPLIGLVEATWYQSKYSLTALYAQRVIDLLERTQGVQHCGLIKPLNMLANFYRVQGRFAEAERLFFRSLSIWITMILQETSGLEPSSSSVVLRQAEEEPYAHVLIQRALSLWEQAPGHHHDPIGQALASLSHVYQQQQRYKEAETILFPLLRLGEQAYRRAAPYSDKPPDDPSRSLQGTGQAGRSRCMLSTGPHYPRSGPWVRAFPNGGSTSRVCGFVTNYGQGRRSDSAGDSWYRSRHLSLCV